MAPVLLVQIVVTVSIVLALAWATSRVMAGRSAASRHLAWTLALLIVIALPVITLVSPEWHLPILPLEPVERKTSHARMQGSIVVASDDLRADFARAFPLADIGSLPLEVSGSINVRSVEAPAATKIDPLPWILGIWAVGALLGLLRLSIGIARVARLARRAPLVRNLSWRVALAESSRALSLKPNVDVRMSERTAVPVTCGLWRPTVLLPPAADSWADDRRRVVLLHELAHVKRGDCLIQVLAQVAVAVHWFNPLVHLAVRRLRFEQERACDDLVILSGTEAPTYADHLVELARAIQMRGLPAWATLAMAQPSQLEGRLRAILDQQQLRRTASPRIRLLASSLVILTALPLGVIRLTAEQSRPAPMPTPAPIALMQAPAVQPVPMPEPVPGPAPSPGQRTPAPPAPAPAPWHVQVVAPTPHIEFDHLSPTRTDRFEHVNVNTHVTPWYVEQATRAPADPAQEEARRRAAEALGTALNDQDERVRQAAVQALSNMRDPRAIPGLLRALQSSDVSVRQMAVNSLRRFDTDEAIGGLVTAMKDTSPEIRMQAAGALSATTNARAIDALTAALKDSDPRVRERAASSLGHIASGRKGRLTSDLYFDELRLKESVARTLVNTEEVARVTAELSAMQTQFGDMRAQLTAAQAQRDAVNSEILQQKMDETRQQIDVLREKLNELRAPMKHTVVAPAPLPPAPPAAPTAPRAPAPPATPPR